MSPSSDGVREFALLGHPVEHSVSPQIHMAAFRTLGLPARYVARDVACNQLHETMQRYARTGGGNVTLPHKARAARVLDRRTREVADTGACNCFWRDPDGLLFGDNTDVGGFLAAVRELTGSFGLQGARVLVLGAGGAARAVLTACLREEVAHIDLRNRTDSRSRLLVDELARTATCVRVLESEEMPEGPYDLAVNATSLGLRPGDELPVDPVRCGASAVLDLVYAPGRTAWVREAAGQGIPARDGAAMLVHQAVLSLRRWYPELEPPLEAMRDAVRKALTVAE